VHFPEGRLTSDGEIGAFRTGMMRILQETPVPVIPMALTGLWDSMFSRKYPRVWQRWPRRFWPKIGLTVGEPVPPEHAKLELLRQRVVELRGDKK
jgi:1-acyl-sn-glycerol-3-phosphate acyltransferase